VQAAEDRKLIRLDEPVEAAGEDDENTAQNGR
jgi:putative glutamine amidotransferase